MLHDMTHRMASHREIEWNVARKRTTCVEEYLLGLFSHYANTHTHAAGAGCACDSTSECVFTLCVDDAKTKTTNDDGTFARELIVYV